MKFHESTGLVFLAATIALLNQTVYGENVAHPVVPRSDVRPGHYRPYIWFATTSNPNALVHAPGQTLCDSSDNLCYYNPADLWTAYATQAFQSSGNYGQGITIGIVDAYYNNQTFADLQGFSTYYGLPLTTGTPTINCGTTPTVTIVSQTGGTPTAGFNSNWAQETDLDVQWAHAMAPCANILLVTASSNSSSDLETGVQYAMAHADVVTNSWGGPEGAGETAGDTIYSKSNVPLLFSSGDVGANVEYPCASQYVTCVGGTHLLTTSGGFRTAESAWSAGGGGCSTQVSEPSYQSTPAPGFSTATCGSSSRGVPDIGALADPYTGVQLYLGTNLESTAAVYCCIGGTSLASPLLAGIIADIDEARLAISKQKLSGANIAARNLVPLLYQAANYTPAGSNLLPAPYGNAYRSYFFDVFTGSSGFAATLYWDRTSGLGVPISPALANYLVHIVP